MSLTDHFYLSQPEPRQSCLLALRDIILAQDANISHTIKYGMPFFCYKNKMFCYLWVNKKLDLPYLGIVEGKHFNQPELIEEKRSRMKTMLIDPNSDLPVQRISQILQQAIDLYRKGIVKI